MGKDTDHRGHPRPALEPAALAWAYHALRLFLGTVFLYASYDKILHPREFAQAVYNYQILPTAAASLAAVVLPWLELLLGLCLAAGVWLPGAVLTSSGLMTVFIAALTFNLSRGLDVHCGCFSTEATGAAADFWTVARDSGLLMISAFLTWRVFSRGAGLERYAQRKPS